jgi:hypothetical protein
LVHRAKQVEITVQAREFEEQSLAYQIREFVLCGLPYKPLASTKYKRQNGDFSCSIVADPDYGLPYGQDRLVIIWLATSFQLLGCPKDNLIRFRSASDVVRAFFPDGQEREPSGTERTRLRQRFERLFHSTFFFRDNSLKTRYAVDSFRLIRRMSLWFDADEQKHGLWQNVIQLTDEFANLIREHSIPFDLQGIRGLKESPAALDLYLWVAWRTFRLKPSQEVSVPLFGPKGFFAQSGGEASETWKLRQLLKGWLTEVKLFWPQCPAELSEDGLYLVLRRPPSYDAFAVHDYAPILLPGVAKHPPLPLLPGLPPFTLDLDDNPSDDNETDK